MATASGGSFDDVLKMTGTHGRWQWTVFVLTSLSGFFVAFHNMGAAFLAAVPQHWCDSEHFDVLRTEHGWSEADVRKTFVPKLPDGSFSSCEMFDVPPNVTSTVELHPDLDDLPSWNETSAVVGQRHSVRCSQWTYNHSWYISTVVSEWDLVCGEKALGSTVQSSFMSGVLLGSIVYGWISDRFGRRKAVLVSLVQFLVAALAAAWSTNYLMFVVIRFVCAVGDAGVFSVAFVIITEISGRSSRALLGLQYMMPFSFGFMVLPLIAYYVRDWFWLQLAISLPSLLLLSYFWLLPESPRWLVTKARFHEAARVLEAGSRCNGRKLPPTEELLGMLQVAHNQGKSHQENARTSGNFLDLVRTPVIRKRSLVIGLCWFVAGLVYYGVSFSAPNLGTSVYLFIFLAAAVEVPAFLLVYVVIERYGRRPCYIVSMLVSGICCLAILVTPADFKWGITVFALLVKFFSTANFGLAFLYTVELFPTPVRNLSVGTGAMLSRLGAVVAPFVVDILNDYHDGIPMAAFGLLCLVSGLMSIYLPETLHKNLPETVEEIEDKDFVKEVELINMNRTENASA